MDTELEDATIEEEERQEAEETRSAGSVDPLQEAQDARDEEEDEAVEALQYPEPPPTVSTAERVGQAIGREKHDHCHDQERCDHPLGRKA